MTMPLDLCPDRLAEEAAAFQRKLDAGFGILREIDNVDYGATTKQEIWRDGKTKLYRFIGDQTPIAKIPLLISYALVNRPYMVDLQADKSLVRKLLALGEDVHVIDWGYPERSDRFLSLEDYIERFIGGAVDHLRDAHNVGAINLLGICQGGVFALCYTALHPAKIRNLMTMVTPVDFHTADNLLSNWVREIDVDLFVDTLGNVPANMMNLCYLTLKPWRLCVQKYIGAVDSFDNKSVLEDFLRMEKWIFDSPDQAGEAFRQFLRDFYQDNGFVKRSIRIGERAVCLGRVEMPVLNIYADQDHLVPPAASRALKDLVGSDDYSEFSFRGGHIGIYVSARAQQEVPDAIHTWLRAR